MVSSELLKKYEFKEEEIEKVTGATGVKNGFPKPFRSIRFTIDSPNVSIEESYFWLLNFIRHDVGFYDVTKITDIFTGSELSTFWGQSQQRMSIQQDRAMALMKYVSDLVKALYQVFREIKAIDERLDLYKGVKKGKEEDAITLESYWVDLVEGGAKNPASVLGLSREVGFTLLPDLFFSAPPNLQKEGIKKYIDDLKVGNRKTKEVLMRKLNQYIEWRDLTEKELNVRRKFSLKDLRFKYNSIMLYARWLKPYLFAAKKLAGGDNQYVDPSIVSAFETSMMELELLARIPSKKYHPCILLNIVYTTKPSMDFVQPPNYQHRGPIHIGRMEVQLKGYSWSDKEYENYIKMKRDEEFQLLSDIDQSIGGIIDAMGEDLKAYLKEAGESIEEKKEEKNKEERKPNTIFEPFTSILKGFVDIGTVFFPKKTNKKTPKIQIEESKEAKAKAEKIVDKLMFVVYNIYKKSHGMLSD